MNLTVVIHGGAGTINREVDGTPYYNSLKTILQEIYSFSMKTPNVTAVDICEHGVKLLEDNELFNAGKGAVYTNAETHELDASIMDGTNLQCGAVTQIKCIKNPISCARAVMEHSVHNFIVGSTAEKIARENGCEVVDPTYFDTEKRYQQLQEAKLRSIVTLDHNLEKGTQREISNAKKGTVGCVVCFNGKLAAATSTGGMTNKLPGRVGDSPVIGAGTYASEVCAVSATGNGEEFIRNVISYDVHARMLYASKSLKEAAELAVSKLPEDCGGVICVDKAGNYALPYNTDGMFRGILTSNGDIEYGIWDEMKTDSCSL